MGIGVSAPAQAEDLTVAYVTPAEMTPELAASRQQPVTVPLRPSFSAEPPLTNDLLQAYVERQKELKSFSNFDVQPQGKLTEQVLLG